MDKKIKKPLTEFEKKYIAEEIKKTKEFNKFLAATNMKVATYKRPQTNGDSSNDKK